MSTFDRRERRVLSTGKIRIRHGENEIEVEGSAPFINKQLDAFYERIQRIQPVSAPATLKRDIQISGAKKALAKIPAEFYKSKNRTDGIAQILIFGKYLEEFHGKTEFTRQDIKSTAVKTKVAEDIHGQYFSNAVRQGA